MSEEEFNFYNPFDAAKFTNDNCFLCGCDLDETNRSDEHVFPKWIQHEFNLWDQRIVLANRTSIPYRFLTIPCCKTCNNIHLSSLETDIKAAYEGGLNVFIELDELRIYQWLCKIYYGILFKELSLLADRRNPELGTIMTPEVLERHRTLHAFLQSVRMPFQFNAERPWSIFVMETMTHPERELNYTYHDNVIGLTFSIRLGNIGILACLEDAGAQKIHYDYYFKKLDGIRLHPIQFDELAAKVTYKALLLNRIPKYMNILPEREGGTVYVVTLNIHGMSAAPIFDEWDQKMYARILASYWDAYGLDFSKIFIEPNLVYTMIENDDGSIKVLNLDGSVSHNHIPESVDEEEPER